MLCNNQRNDNHFYSGAEGTNNFKHVSNDNKAQYGECFWNKERQGSHDIQNAS